MPTGTAQTAQAHQQYMQSRATLSFFSASVSPSSPLSRPQTPNTISASHPPYSNQTHHRPPTNFLTPPPTINRVGDWSVEQMPDATASTTSRSGHPQVGGNTLARGQFNGVGVSRHVSTSLPNESRPVARSSSPLSATSDLSEVSLHTVDQVTRPSALSTQHSTPNPTTLKS